MKAAETNYFTDNTCKYTLWGYVVTRLAGLAAVALIERCLGLQDAWVEACNLRLTVPPTAQATILPSAISGTRGCRRPWCCSAAAAGVAPLDEAQLGKSSGDSVLARRRSGAVRDGQQLRVRALNRYAEACVGEHLHVVLPVTKSN